MATEDFGDYRLPRRDRLNNYQAGDTVFVNHGIHGLKMGFDTQRIQFNQNTTSQVGGLLTFTNFLQGIPSRFDSLCRAASTPIADTGRVCSPSAETGSNRGLAVSERIPGHLRR